MITKTTFNIVDTHVILAQMEEVDETTIQDPETDCHAKNDDEGITWADEIDAIVGSKPYCFRLKTDHAEGALGAMAAYTPWWQEMKNTWEKEIRAEKTRFSNWTKDRFTNNKKAATHVAMNSGELIVPLGPEEDQFLKSMAKSLTAGKKFYFVELIKYEWPVPCFRLFVDLDFKQIKGITERGIEAASIICAKTVNRFFTVKSKTIVTSTTYKEDSALDATGIKIQRIKTGVHLYWPSYFVTATQAMHIRESLISDLNEFCGSRFEPQKNSWEDVVDKSVYGDTAAGKQGSGLRMVGNYKTAPCKVCKGKKSAGGPKCENCGGRGKVNDLDMQGRGRPYMLLCVLSEPDEYGAIERDEDSESAYMGPDGPYKLLCDTKIRTSLKEDTLECGFEVPSGAPLYLGNAAVKRPRVDGQVIKKQRRLDATDPIIMSVQDLIRSAFGDIYSSVQVRQVTKCTKGFSATISGQNCRYCQNIGREHSSNNIYFMLTKEGIAQRCFDDGPKTAEMKHGPCRDYVGGTLALDLKTTGLLWPESNKFVDEANALSNNTFFMRCLLNIGEFLATEAHGISWTATLNLGTSGKAPNKDFLPQDPRDLGSKGIQAYKDLGLAWADALLLTEKSGATADAENEVPKEPRKSILSFEKELFDAFNAIVTVAACAQDPRIFTECERLDDFLMPSEEL